mgnify:CR=1 FL=1
MPNSSCVNREVGELIAGTSYLKSHWKMISSGLYTIQSTSFLKQDPIADHIIFDVIYNPTNSDLEVNL